MQTVNIKRLKLVIETAYKIKRPVLALGSPGVGKSQGMLQAATELGIGFLDVRATLLDPVDLRGIPTIGVTLVNDEKVNLTEWAQPVFLPTEGKGILLIDELPTAPPMVQAALLQLILDRKVGEYELPEGWVCMAAGNKVTDKAGASKISTALASRFIKVNVTSDPKEWREWAISASVPPEVISFLDWKPGLLYDFDPKIDDAFPCPRTWEFVGEVVGGPSGDDSVDLAMIEGCIGQAAAAEFVGFLRICRSLKAPEVYLANPEKEPIPSVSEPAVLYALCGALAESVAEMEDGTPIHAEAVTILASRFPTEYGVLLIDTAIRRNPAFADTTHYIDWTMNNTATL